MKFGIPCWDLEKGWMGEPVPNCLSDKIPIKSTGGKEVPGLEKNNFASVLGASLLATM